MSGSVSLRTVDINKVKVIGQGDGYKMIYITSVGVSGCPPNPMGVFYLNGK